MHAHNFFQYIHVMDKQVTAAYNRKDHALHLSGWVKVTFTNAEGMLAFTNAIDRRIDAYITNYDINNIVALLLPHLNKHAVQKFGIRHVCLRRLTCQNAEVQRESALPLQLSKGSLNSILVRTSVDRMHSRASSVASRICGTPWRGSTSDHR